MPYSEVEAKFLGPGKELTSETCYKKLKSSADSYVFPHHGGPDIYRIQEKTANNWVPGTRGNGSQDKTRTTDSLKPQRDEMPSTRLEVTESVGSQASQDGKPSLMSSDDEIYSTSKAFIGPIYNPTRGKKSNKRKSDANSLNSISGKARLEEKQKFNSKKSEIDTELSQFYKEIEELENEKDASQDSCKEPELSQGQVTPYYQGYNDDILKSAEENKGLCSALQSHGGYQQHFENEPGRYPCDEQPIPTFYDFSFPSFRPEWQSVHPFIMPHGPPLPSFNYHLNTHRFSAPPNPPPNIFHAQDDSRVQNGCCVNTCQDSGNCLTFDPNNEYINYTVNSSNAHPARNSYDVQDGYGSNGFCEIREECWNDPFLDRHNGTDRFVNQQFQEEKLNLQKLLILLRGLPGSGKTTLSRILLGRSRDGIVFSTDDYFRHQDGYRYNVSQLGDAHDWNQNRAKQAINQGRSPVIIDNTNTQAWEMKPYVEMAIGKGYRVEFHEPETWWKFDPEELEKRNKHGVSRKKIAQMLDRYEYHVSIAIVMNSVEPPQKSTQRPLPLQGTQRERIWKKSGHRFGKTKQKRSRKGNQKHNVLCEIVDENLFETLSYLTPKDQDPSQSEEEDIEEIKKESGCVQNGERAFMSGCKEKYWRSTNPADSFQNVLSTVELNNTPKNCLPQEEDDVLLTLSSAPNVSSAPHPTGTQRLSCGTRVDHVGVEVGKPMGHGHTLTLDAQSIFSETPCSLMKKADMEDKSFPDEPVLCHQNGSNTSEKVFNEEQAEHTFKNDCWKFFTTNLSDKDLHLDSESQPYFGIWPEGPLKFLFEQKPKKDRSCRVTCPKSREQLIKLISTSEGASESVSNPERLIEENRLMEINDLSLKTETTESPKDPEMNVFKNCLAQLAIPKYTLESAKEKQRLRKRIFNLQADFTLLGQTRISQKEKDGLLVGDHRLDIVLGEKDHVSERNNKKEKKQRIITFDKYLLWLYLDIIKDSHLSIGQFCAHYLSLNRLELAGYFYKNPISSFVLYYISSFWMVSFNKKVLTFKSQRTVGNKLIDVVLGKILAPPTQYGGHHM